MNDIVGKLHGECTLVSPATDLILTKQWTLFPMMIERLIMTSIEFLTASNDTTDLIVAKHVEQGEAEIINTHLKIKNV